MVKLVQYKYQKVMDAYAQLDSMNRIQCAKLVTEIDWLLRNGVKYTNKPDKFTKKMNSIKNAIQEKFAENQQDVSL